MIIALIIRNMILENLFKKGKSWIESNSVLMTFGDVEARKSPTVICDNEKTSIEEFLEIGKRCGTKVFFVNMSMFNENDRLDEINFDHLCNDKVREVESHIERLEEFKDRIEFLCFFYIIDGVVYEYGLLSDWWCKIDEIVNDIEEIVNIGTDEKESLSDEIINDLSETLAKNESFFKNRGKYDKLELILHETLNSEGIADSEVDYYIKSRVIALAKSYFDQNLLEKKEAELSIQIADLKSKGNPKVAIKSKLDITESMLNKHCYK